MKHKLVWLVVFAIPHIACDLSWSWISRYTDIEFWMIVIGILFVATGLMLTVEKWHHGT